MKPGGSSTRCGCGLRRKENRPPVYIGIDEKSFRPGQKSYVTLICDLVKGTVEWVGEDRKAATVAAYFDQFTPAQLEEIEGFAMDMWRAYTKAVVDGIPDGEARSAMTASHVMQEVNEAWT